MRPPLAAPKVASMTHPAAHARSDAATVALTPLSVELAALADEAGTPQPPSELRLVPAGEFRARDGRPASTGPDAPAAWRMDAANAAACIRFAAAQADDAVIDYEHQTLHASTNGQPAPAAGWWTAAGMQYRDAPADQGGGLWATALRWTERARAMIAAGEYRYFSPVIAWDKATGNVRAVVLGALTNRAALDGLTDLTPLAALSAGLSLPDIDTDTDEESSMDLAALRKLLALSDDADEAAIRSAIAALKTKADTADEARTQLSALSAELEEAKRATKPDLSQYVPKAVHDEALAALRATQQQGSAAELDQLITDGLKSGQIPGKATADWLRGLGLPMVREYLTDAPAVPAFRGTQKAGQGADGEPAALSVDEANVARMLGLSIDAYRAIKAQETEQ